MMILKEFLLVVLLAVHSEGWDCPKSPEEALEDLKYRSGEVALRVVGDVSHIQKIVAAAGGDGVTSKNKEGTDAGILFADTPAAFLSDVFNATSHKNILSQHPSTIRWYFFTDDNNTNVDGIIKFIHATDLIEPMKRYVSKPTLLDWLLSLPPRVTTTYKVNTTSIQELEESRSQLVDTYNNNPHIVLLESHKIGSRKLLESISDSISEVITTELSNEATLSATLQNIYVNSLLMMNDKSRFYTDCIETLKKRKRMKEEVVEKQGRYKDIVTDIEKTDMKFGAEKEDLARDQSLFYQIQLAVFILCVSGVTGSGYVSLVIAWPFVKSVIGTVCSVFKRISAVMWSIIIVARSIWGFLSAPPTPGLADQYLKPPSSFEPEIISLDIPDSLKRSSTVRGAWRKAGKALYATRRLIKSVKVVSPIKKEELGFPTKVSRLSSNVSSRDRTPEYPGVVVLNRACGDTSYSGISFLRRAINQGSPLTGDDLSRTTSSLSSRGWAALRSKCSFSMFSSASDSSFDLRAAQSKIADLEMQLQSQQHLLREKRQRLMNSSFNSTASHSTVRTFPISDVDTDDESDLLCQSRFSHVEN